MNASEHDNPSDSSQDQRRSFHFTIMQVLLILATLMVALWVWAKPSHTVISQWRLPKDYPASQVQYYVSVVEDVLDFGTIIPRRKYSIFIGRGSSINYGHFANFPYDPSTYTNGSVAEHISMCEVETTTAGVTFKTPPGHILFIPASAYLGGR